MIKVTNGLEIREDVRGLAKILLLLLLLSLDLPLLGSEKGDIGAPQHILVVFIGTNGLPLIWQGQSHQFPQSCRTPNGAGPVMPPALLKSETPVEHATFKREEAPKEKEVPEPEGMQEGPCADSNSAGDQNGSSGSVTLQRNIFAA